MSLHPALPVDRLRVVIADADPAERKRVLDTVAELTPAPPLVFEAGDGTHALALCREQKPQVLISEILLEGHSGLALLRQLIAERISPRVVFVTALARESDRYWGLRSGAYAYVTKPYDTSALRERLLRLLDGAQPQRPDE